MNLIEVERKFCISPDVKQKLRNMIDGSEEVSFEDSYYSEELALKDKWLRQRNGVWELKIPVGSTQESYAGTTIYRELLGSSLTEELLREGLSLNQASVFAKLRTIRTRTVLPWKEYDVTITLDESTSDDGFECSIGEVEILAKYESEVQDACSVLEEVMRHLNLPAVESSEGKLMAFLRAKRPEFHEKLRSKGLG